MQLGLEVGAARRACGCTPATAPAATTAGRATLTEQVAEDVAEAAEVLEVEGLAAGAEATIMVALSKGRFLCTEKVG